jgi:hypothetical protein
MVNAKTDLGNKKKSLGDFKVVVAFTKVMFLK